MTNFNYTPTFPIEKDNTEYEFITKEGVKEERFGKKIILNIHPRVLELLSERAFGDISHLLRPSHLKQLKNILEDGEASDNDKYVALEMLKNANISSAGILPMCQDTGTAIVLGYKGEMVQTGHDDVEQLSKGIYNTYQSRNLRYSQLSATSMFEEKNTNSNLPAQVEIYSTTGSEYKFAFIQKGGGSANKSFLFQKT